MPFEYVSVDEAIARRGWRMVVVGGIAQALMLPLIGLGVTYLRHTHVPEEIQPSVATTVLLWLSTAVMFAFAIYSGWSALRA